MRRGIDAVGVAARTRAAALGGAAVQGAVEALKPTKEHAPRWVERASGFGGQGRGGGLKDGGEEGWLQRLGWAAAAFRAGSN
jgi:hypothetical protein